jgi:hypothetical protein
MASTHFDRFRNVDAFFFLMILAVAAGVRVWYVRLINDNTPGDSFVQVQDPPPPVTGLPPGEEAYGQANPHELHALLYNLREHQWFGGPAPFAGDEELTAHVAPGYPWLLALLERSPLGLTPVAPYARWIQCGLGALTAALYFAFCRRAFGSRLVSVLAGLMGALYPFWVFNTAELNDGVVATFLLALGVWLGARGAQDGGAFTSLLYGLTLAGLVLVRAAMLPFAFAALLWFLLRCRSLRAGWLSALLAFLGFVSSLVPWTMRNYQTCGAVVPVVSSTPLHLWAGNHPRATGGPQTEQALLEALAEQRGEDPRETAEFLARHNQVERYGLLTRETVQAIRSDPAGAIQRRIWAGLFFFFGEDWFTRHQLWRENPAAADLAPPGLTSWLPVLLPGSLLGLLLLGALGWRWTYGWRYEAMPSSLAVFWIPLPYLLSHAEALHGPRLPLDGVLLCYAAFALVYLTVPTVGSVLRLGPVSERE